MIKAICQWFSDVFGPLTAEEIEIMHRDGAWLRDRYGVAPGSCVAVPLTDAARVQILRNEIEFLQAQIDRAIGRHQPVKRLRQKLSRTMGELLVAVS